LRAAAEFAIATRDELWSHGALIESRLSHGTAIDDGTAITAIDTYDEELVRACEEAIRPLREDVPADAHARLVASARREHGDVVCEAAMTITIGGVSAVTRDASRLRELLALQGSGGRGDAALVWRNGSAAVLLHEAVGHAAEHHAPPVAWPEWLTVHDEPGLRSAATQSPPWIGEGGNSVAALRRRDLLREPPATLRRESFRDIPLPRMTNLVARQHGAPFAVPAHFIDVHLVAGGFYDPLTDVVTIDVAVSSAGPFTIRDSRANVAASLLGAMGEPLEYPGVICSREGQELVVGSHAPVLVTR
jgi:hypothetical protein